MKHSSFEPRYDKTIKMSVRQRRLSPVWSESSLSAWRNLGSLDTHWAHSEDSDQSNLIWVFAGRTLTLLVLSCRGWHYFRNVVVSYRLEGEKRCVGGDRAGCLAFSLFRNIYNVLVCLKLFFLPFVANERLWFMLAALPVHPLYYLFSYIILLTLLFTHCLLYLWLCRALPRDLFIVSFH